MSLHFIFPSHHTDYDHLLLSPNTPFPFFFSFFTCPQSSVNGPTTTYTASSGMFGNFRPRASRVPATRHVRYNWRLFEALSSNAPPPQPPLTQPLPNGTPISPQYTLVVISATFPFSKCQQGLQLHIYLQSCYGKLVVSKFPEFYAIFDFRYRVHTQSTNTSSSYAPDESSPTSSHLVSIRYTLDLFFHLYQCLHIGLFPLCFPTDGHSLHVLSQPALKIYLFSS